MTYLAMHLISLVCSQFLLLLLLLRHADCGDIVKTLPGYAGELPSTLETGYIGVEESQLFYLFVESTGNPRTDPLLLYIVGGPGCSALNGFFYQVGPLEFNGTGYNGGIPQLLLRPYPWTKTASIIFIDAPVGTGFSYPTTAEGFSLSDTKSARQVYKFLSKWLIEHADYLPNQVFIGSDSYSGVLVPVTAQDIDGNAAGVTPFLHLIGFVSGSVHTNTELEQNARIFLGHRLALVSDRLYENAKESCNGWFVDVDSSNTPCVEAIQKIDQCLNGIYDEGVLDPNYETVSPKPDDTKTRRALTAKGRAFLHSSQNPQTQDWWCKNSFYVLSVIWANNKTVQDALHVREGIFKEWYRCNVVIKDLYVTDIEDAIGYQKNLTNTGLQVLLYNGDHDILIPHIFTEEWLRSLNLTVSDSWRPWFVDGQVAGYKILYSNDGYRLTYATVKGSGHSPTEYYNRKPLKCLKGGSIFILSSRQTALTTFLSCYHLNNHVSCH